MADLLQTTPLHAAHRALGARLMPFAGFDTPVAELQDDRLIEVGLEACLEL